MSSAPSPRGAVLTWLYQGIEEQNEVDAAIHTGVDYFSAVFVRGLRKAVLVAVLIVFVS